MNRRQKNRVKRIIVVLIAFFVLLVLQHTGRLDGLSTAGLFTVYFIPYLIVGWDVIVRAGRNIAHGQVFDENFLMMLATVAAFGISLLGENEYSEALAVMLFYQIGESFQDYAVNKSRKSITEMMDIAPEYANLERDGAVEEVDPDDVHPGDIIVVRPGEKVPLDGTVIEGSSFLDTAALTGESVPRRASEGDDVISGCINGDSVLRVRVSKEYDDSTVAKILELVENSSAKKARLENFITRFARYYTPIVTIGAVVLAVLMPLMFGLSWVEGIRRACNFLIVSCPCALVISVPLGFFGGIGAASKLGVLVKGGNYLEAAAGLKTIVMDKTGTLTKGEFTVQKCIPSASYFGERSGSEEAASELLELAAYAETFSTHPIAQSIGTAYGKEPDRSRLSDSSESAGHGIIVSLDGRELLAGNAGLMEEKRISFDECAEAGTIVYVAYDGRFAGSIVISDTVKEGALEAVRDMKSVGIRKTVMLTGDREAAANAVADRLGIDEVRSDLLPADKVGAVEELIEELSAEGEKGRLGFIGDGINDAPVLMRADVGFAMGSLGSDAAIEAADIVLMDDDLRKVPHVIRIARKTMGIVKTNIAFALIVKAVILVLSAVGLASMWAAVFADVGVSVICIINSMRALNVK
jgi:Cd2+/Zn2+-exporting ATPase